MNFCLKSCTSALFVLLLALAGATPLSAQTTGGLRGLVVDGSDQSPLNLVQVSLTAGGKRYETFTNNDGFYQINAIPVGAYKLSVSRAGYSSQTLDVNRSKTAAKWKAKPAQAARSSGRPRPTKIRVRRPATR